MPDESPIVAEVKDFFVSIEGVSEAGERVSYAPAVQDDGAYTQKLAPGQYTFGTSRIAVVFDGQEHLLPLEPVGRLAGKDRDAADGIVQDFVWKPTGVTPYGQSQGSDPNNHTHWYGMHVRLSADGYRNDLKAAATPLPVEASLRFSLEAKGKGIDGREAPSFSVDRTVDPDGYKNQDLNDLMPARYVLTGVAVLPDGTTKPLLLQGPGDYPGYKPSVEIAPINDQILGKLSGPAVSFVMK
ncbi:hypothetical protein [Alienimonas californiensis]|nr:hypothetical protein [Alienimonas californiensis]